MYHLPSKDRVRYSRGLRRERSPRHEAREEEMKLPPTLPSPAFQAALIETQAEPTVVNSETLGEKSEVVKDTIEEQNIMLSDDGMDLDVVPNNKLSVENDEEFGEDFQNLSADEEEVSLQKDGVASLDEG